MIPELGHFAVILALTVALAQGILPLIGAQRGIASLTAIARPAAVMQFLLIALAFIALTAAFLSSDFSVLNVWQNSHTDKPLLYKISGVWGNHEGSLLLWVFILALFGAAVATLGNNLPTVLRTRVIAIQGLIGVGFLLLLVFLSNPFERVFPVPAQGNGLNPLLQDPGLAFHPPFLYIGYVGFSIAFSFAVAALIEGKVDAAWARWVRPWTLASWTALTIGIAMGSWWAYYELGWGGWWFWDPVENASFMPWLLGTALLHSAIVVEKRDSLKAWTVLLAILTFSFSLLGTFIVRSGVLTSVHAFATDPERGVFILAFLVVAIGGSLALYAWRAPALKGGGIFAPVSREGALVLNNLLLVAATSTVFIGTMYPLFLDAISGEKVTVGPPFFTATFVPLMVPLLAVMAIGPMMPWKRADLAGTLSRLKIAAALTVAVALVTLYLSGVDQILAVLGMALGAWLIFGAATDIAERTKLFRISIGESFRRARNLPRSAWGGAIAHAGLGVAILGMTGTLSWETEQLQIMRPGDRVEIAGYELEFDGVEPVTGPNYDAVRGTFRIYRNGNLIDVMRPETRRFSDPPMVTTEAAIRPHNFGDLYAVVGESNGDGGYATRIYHKPMINWLWIGALVMAAGGLVSLTDRRLRVGAPARRAATASPDLRAQQRAT
ncbi:MAG: heme lyase CcmF/NrfE family subunit [Alphaproteobacteria bacterium]|nr:heme lyase CcmF/NrfE family subunit [Alphaproteobacteria bacterium]